MHVENSQGNSVRGTRMTERDKLITAFVYIVLLGVSSEIGWLIGWKGVEWVTREPSESCHSASKIARGSNTTIPSSLLRQLGGRLLELSSDKWSGMMRAMARCSKLSLLDFIFFWWNATATESTATIIGSHCSKCTYMSGYLENRRLKRGKDERSMYRDGM